MLLGGHLLKHWTRRQQCIALSSGEAELYALNHGAKESLGVQQQLRELGVELPIEVLTDASAARGMVHRTGAGRVKHIEVQVFWLQQKVNTNALVVSKIARIKNIADTMTTCWDHRNHTLFDGLGLDCPAEVP